MSSFEASTKRKFGEADKTPVSILQELCVREGRFINFDEKPHELDPKKFSCTAMAFGWSADGSGRSKKEAKHEACANLLVILQQTERFKAELPSVPSVPRPTNDGDAVGTLLDICVQRNWPLPIFKEIQASGEPHHPFFTYSCQLSSINRKGTFKTKKGAKQIAARSVLEIILSFPQNEEQQQVATIDSEPPEKIFQTYRELKELGIKHQKISIRNRHNFFMCLPEEDRIEATNILTDNSDVFYGSSKDKVDLACTALKIKYDIKDLPNQPFYKIFHLIGKHDCVLADNEDCLYDRVISHFKTMLNIS